MNRKKKLIIAVASSVGFVAIGLAVSAVYICHGDLAARAPAKLFVTTQPRQEDIVGIYQLTRQTITTNGLAVLEGRLCQLDLRPDGSFTATNYPRWSPDSSTRPHVTTFISTTGWRCDSVHIFYKGKDCRGIVFSDSDAAIDALALRSKGAPYDLMLTYGVGDDGTIMQFGRKK
jgi:hypothetical protein